MIKGSIRWAPFPDGAQKCRVVSSAAGGSILVRWLTGPLKGREARIASSGLRQHKRDIKGEDILGEMY